MQNTSVHLSYTSLQVFKEGLSGPSVWWLHLWAPWHLTSGVSFPTGCFHFVGSQFCDPVPIQQSPGLQTSCKVMYWEGMGEEGGRDIGPNSPSQDPRTPLPILYPGSSGAGNWQFPSPSPPALLPPAHTAEPPDTWTQDTHPSERCLMYLRFKVQNTGQALTPGKSPATQSAPYHCSQASQPQSSGAVALGYLAPFLFGE